MERSGIEESTHYMTARQLNSAKILRLAALAQDDSLFFSFIFLGLSVHFLMRQLLQNLIAISTLRFAPGDSVRSNEMALLGYSSDARISMIRAEGSPQVSVTVMRTFCAFSASKLWVRLRKMLFAICAAVTQH